MIYPKYSLKISNLTDITQTIKEMFRLAIQYKDDLEPFRNLNLYQFYNFLKNKVKYVKDPEFIEKLQRPLLTILYGGDCDDKTIVAMSYFELKNLKYRLAIADYGKGFEHIYAEVYLNVRGYIPFDATCYVCDMGAERKYVNKKVFYKEDFEEFKK